MQVFQVIPSVVRDFGDGFEMDVDFAHSLKVYFDHFESFSIACPVLTSDIKGSGLERCISIKELPWGEDRLKFIPLPTTYNPIEFLKSIPDIRKKLISEIENSEYLIFTPYSLIGDWPTIAIREAVRLGRPYTIEADGVHTEIARKRHISNVAWKRFVKRNVMFPLFDLSHRYCLRNSSLAIFQGQDVFAAYAPYCVNAHKLNHHVPVYAGDHITDGQLQTKLEEILKGDVIKICYAGRAIDMKGPLDWIETLHRVAKSGLKFQAMWLGDGPKLEEMETRVAELAIPGVEFAGFVSDREQVLGALKEAHIFLFCHNTPESARILGEALACGAALVGFESAYPVDLVADHGGGVFCKTYDLTGLSEAVKELDGNRPALAKLVRRAARSGAEFDRDAALHKRAELVTQQRFGGITLDRR